MALRDVLNQLKEDALVTARGIGTGATAGFIKYPAASVMVLADRLTAANPQLSYREALGLINEQQKADRERGSLAALGGELVGGLVPGAGLARAGSLPAAIAGGAALGGAGAYNEAQDPNAILTGAAFGGVLGGAGRVAQNAQEKAVRFATARVGAQRADEAAQAIAVRDRQIADKLSLGKLSGSQKKELDKLERSRRSLQQSQSKGEELVKLADEAPIEDLLAAVRPSLKTNKGKMEFSLGALAGSGVGDVLGTTRGRIAQDPMMGLSNTLFGASAGAGVSQLLGGDPVLGALLGGSTGRFIGLTPVLKAKAAGISAIPTAAAPMAAAGVIPEVSRRVAEATQAQQVSAAPAAPAEWDQYFGEEPVADKKPSKNDWESYFD